MAGSYPNLLASGIDDLSRFDQFDLFAGSGPRNTTQMQAADAQAIQQFEVLTLNAAGRLVPLGTSGDYATGTITVGGQPSAADTVTVNGHAITFITSGDPTSVQVLVGADTTETAQSLKDVINADPDTYGVTASGAANVLTLTANSVGTAGNSIALAEGVTSASFTISGSTLSGANAAEDVPSGNAVAIAAQPVDAATPGGWVPIFISGGFNHEALVWPAGMGTLAQRKLVFAGTPIYVQQLL